MKTRIFTLSIVALTFLVLLSLHTILAELPPQPPPSPPPPPPSSSPSSLSIPPPSHSPHHPNKVTRPPPSPPPILLPPPPRKESYGHAGYRPPSTRVKKKDGDNPGKLLGLLFAGVAGVLQVCFVGFLVFKRRQYLKVINRYQNFNE